MIFIIVCKKSSFYIALFDDSHILNVINHQFMSSKIKKYIEKLVSEYRELSKGKERLLEILTETEISEQVYNSNAIENSSLTLRDTEKILLNQETHTLHNLREVYEAKNLGSICDFQVHKLRE